MGESLLYGGAVGADSRPGGKVAVRNQRPGQILAANEEFTVQKNVPERGGWWGEYTFEEGSVKRWQIYPLSLEVRRTDREWQLSYLWTEKNEEDTWKFEEGLDGCEELLYQERFVFRKTDPVLRLTPVLPDRDLVASPRIPLHVPPGEEATLYLSSPLWLRLETGSPGLILQDIPVRRSSDCWFGSLTEAGELCYAVRTRAVLDWGRLGALYRRAVTPLLVRNEMSRTFRVERLKLPVRFLSIYEDASHYLWTEALQAVQKEDSELAMVTFAPGAPAQSSQSKRLAGPREAPQPGILIRVFSSLFGEKGEGGTA